MKKGSVLALSVVLGIVMIMTVLTGCSQPFGAPESRDYSAKTLPTVTPVVRAPHWDANEVYVAGDVVYFDYNHYEAKWWNQGEEPGSVEWGAWKVIPTPATPTPTNTPTPTFTPTPTPTATYWSYFYNSNTLPATNITKDSATISGETVIAAPVPESTAVSVKPKLEYWVQGSTEKILAGEDYYRVPPTNYSVNLTGLTPNTTYEYQYTAQYGGEGEVLSFTTLMEVTPTPTVTVSPTVGVGYGVTNDATNITETSAVISGATYGAGVGVDYGLELRYWLAGDSANKIVAASAFKYATSISLSTTLTNLEPNTTYEFEYVSMPGGSGETKSFTTLGGVAAWNASAVYVAGDKVTYAGKTWTAKWWTQGEEPGSVEWGAWE